jgi:hypothetical protein
MVAARHQWSRPLRVPVQIAPADLVTSFGLGKGITALVPEEAPVAVEQMGPLNCR